MPWFKVDDKFCFHPKVVAAGNEAIGVWARCGSYAMNHLTDGFVPQALVEAIQGDAAAARLVETGLWREVRGGFQFHDWTDNNPSKAKLTEKRGTKAERMRQWREEKRKREREGPEF